MSRLSPTSSGYPSGLSPDLLFASGGLGSVQSEIAEQCH